MQTSTILYIIAAAIVVLGIVLFQYYYNSKKRGKLAVILSFLRFLALFGVFLLLINPKFTKNDYTLEKANLVILTDNSSSVASAKEEIEKALNNIDDAQVIQDKFTLSKYAFGENLRVFDSISFLEKNTNIAKALKQVRTTYGNTKTAIVLLTDGNQTIGDDYGFLGNQYKHEIYPIAVGDTTQYEDVRIGNVNSNKFAFLKNKFPIEFSVSYTGKAPINTSVSISLEGKRMFTKNLQFSNKDNVKSINTLLNANEVGVKKIKISVNTIPKERNVNNNTKYVAVEVIDEKTNIAIISKLKHPDIGALKKAIETNEQRSVKIYQPNASINELEDEDIDVFIFYQPNASFSSLYKFIQQKKASLFTILGERVNANFLNQIQNTFKVDGNYPKQETFPVLNAAYTKFDISDFDVTSYPPLSYGAGLLDYSNGEALLQMKIMGQNFDTPLLFTVDKENSKEVVLLGENLWKWRMQTYRDHQNFEIFDGFIGKLMLYLASNKNKSRLEVDYQSIYTGSNETKVRAFYFDEAFEFDKNATLVLQLTNKTNGSTSEFPMLLHSNYYQADLSYLSAGDYAFNVKVKSENYSKSGNFTLLDFDVEQQFSSTDYKKLGQLAKNTNGKLFYADQINELAAELSNDSQYVPTQKSTKNVVSLIDFRTLLALIIVALTAEWFLRKYNGLV